MMRIGVVSSRTGLRAATIRAWERRYGLLTPARSEHGQRLYGEQDVRVLLEVADRVRSGWALSAAAGHIARSQRESDEHRATLEPRQRHGVNDPHPHWSGKPDAPASQTQSGPRRGEPRPIPLAPQPSSGESSAGGRTTLVVGSKAGENVTADQVALLAVHDTLRALVWAEHPTAVVAALVDLVERLGARVGPAAPQSRDIIPVDLGLGETDPLLARAEPFSVARLRLEAILPALVEDARRMVTLMRAAGR